MRFLLFLSMAAICSCNSSDKSAEGNVDSRGSDTTTINSTTTAPIVPVKISASAIPAAITVKGSVKEAWKWNDKQGENILITSVVSPYEDNRKNEYGEEGQTAALYATLFQKKGDTYESAWSITEEVKACPVDITCDFIGNSTTVTDLDLDEIAEIKLQYATACKGDVSPASMKLILYENGNIYSLKGQMWISIGPESKYEVTEENVNLENSPKKKDETDELLWSFGRYESEKDFANAPASFLQYARKEWLNHSKEKTGE